MGVHPTFEFWNQAILEFAKFSALFREPNIFLDDAKQVVPNSDGGVAA